VTASSRASRWALAGAVAGTLAGLIAFAPARWVGWAVSEATQGRVILAQAQGTAWSGQARVTLTGGPGSRDALTLPGRLSWDLGLDLAGRSGWPWSAPAQGAAGGGWAGRLTLHHSECMPVPVALRFQPGIGRWTLSLPARKPQEPASLMQWPAAWLGALGTPWNTLQPSGQLRLSSPGGSLQWTQGRFQLDGALVLEAENMASRLSTLDRLGSYRAVVSGGGSGAEVATLQLSTVDGALLLSGTGQWTGARFRLRGEARAAPGQEAALQNLLNLIGTRDGARSILSIG